MKTAADPQQTPSSAGTALVDRHWLSAHLDDPQVRVIEVDVSPAAYNDWHIQGAVLWNIYADLKDADYHTVGTEALQKLITRSGLDPGSTVVCYGYAPALAFWLMRLHGHRDVRILDCSRDTWHAENLPCSTTTSQPPPGTLVLHDDDLDHGIQADLATVRDAINRPDATLLDVRSAPEYHGERFWPSGATEPGGQAGHVPSAVHQPIDDLHNPDGSFRSASELRRLFSPAALDGDTELITYCTIGGRAATAWFVLTALLGRDNVRVYDGSWAEWGRTLGLPVTRP